MPPQPLFSTYLRLHYFQPLFLPRFPWDPFSSPISVLVDPRVVFRLVFRKYHAYIFRKQADPHLPRLQNLLTDVRYRYRTRGSKIFLVARGLARNVYSALGKAIFPRGLYPSPPLSLRLVATIYVRGWYENVGWFKRPLWKLRPRIAASEITRLAGRDRRAVWRRCRAKLFVLARPKPLGGGFNSGRGINRPVLFRA